MHDLRSNRNTKDAFALIFKNIEILRISNVFILTHITNNIEFMLDLFGLMKKANNNKKDFESSS